MFFGRSKQNLKVDISKWKRDQKFFRHVHQELGHGDVQRQGGLLILGKCSICSKESSVGTL